MTDELWDWADVAALKFKRPRWHRIWERALQREFAAAIRYGYKQARRHKISELERLREAAARVVACVNDELLAFGDELLSGPMMSAVEQLRKAIGE